MKHKKQKWLLLVLVLLVLLVLFYQIVNVC